MWHETNSLHFIYQFLPPDAKLLLLEEPNRRPAVVTADFDGDNIHEIAAAYRWNDNNGIVILKWFEGYWYPISYIKGSGYGITYLSTAPITGKNTHNLIIGWQHGAIYSQLDIQEWSSDGFKSLINKETYFSEIEVANIPTKEELDNKFEIALWSHDTGNAYVVEVYQWDGTSLVPFPQAYPHYFKKVAEYYKKQVITLPDAAFYWYYLADAHFKAEKYHEAFKAIDIAIKLNAAYPPYKTLISLKELILSNLKKASFLYPAALKTVDGTKWGYINSYGVFKIKPQYDNAMDFQDNGLAIVSKEGHTGIIDRNGRYIVPLQYYNINPFSEGRATVSDASGTKVIDESGKVVTNKSYSYIGTYQNGRAIFNNLNDEAFLYGYLDKLGNEVIHAQYVTANDFINGQAIVKVKDNQYALIGLSGETLQSYPFAFVNNAGDGLLPFQPEANSKYGYIEIDGTIVIPAKYSMALPFSNNRAVVNIAEDYSNQFGLIDKTDTFILNPIYNDVNPIGEGNFSVGKAIDPERPYIGSKYAIADRSGNILTSFNYTSLLPYDKGYSSASDGSNTFFLDREGKPAKALPTIEGDGTLSFVGDLIKANVDQRIFYLDRTGKIVWQQNTVIPLNAQYQVLEEKYKLDQNYLVYYPQISGIKNDELQNKINAQLKALSLVPKVDDQLPLDYSYSGDFSIEFFKKSLLVLRLDGYQYYFGAAHGMPSQIYPNINLTTGQFYSLGDLFKADADYVKILSDIIGEQIKNDPQYTYIFPDEYKGISQDQPFYVNEDALYIYFAPYEIAAYAAGFPTFRIPYTEILPIIDRAGSFWQAFH